MTGAGGAANSATSGSGGGGGGIGADAHIHKCDRTACNCRCHDIMAYALSDKLPGPPALVREPPDCGAGTADVQGHEWDLGGGWMGPRGTAEAILEFFGVSALHTCRRCLAQRLQMDALPAGMGAPDGGACYMRADDWMAWWLPLLHKELAADFWHGRCASKNGAPPARAAHKTHKTPKTPKTAPASRERQQQRRERRREPAFSCDKPIPQSWFTPPPSSGGSPNRPVDKSAC